MSETTTTTPIHITSQDAAKQAQQEREAAPPPADGIYRTTGRRKSAVARVRLKAGTGEFVINKKRTLDQYFGREQDRLHALSALHITGTAKKYDVLVNTHGGGSHGQAGAIRLGIARALIRVEPQQYQTLKDGGFLTRDSREVERKKPGKAGARRSFQFSKR
jgi:small subunit ribosomal protein S9